MANQLMCIPSCGTKLHPISRAVAAKNNGGPGSRSTNPRLPVATVDENISRSTAGKSFEWGVQCCVVLRAALLHTSPLDALLLHATVLEAILLHATKLVSALLRYELLLIPRLQRVHGELSLAEDDLIPVL